MKPRPSNGQGRRHGWSRVGRTISRSPARKTWNFCVGVEPAFFSSWLKPYLLGLSPAPVDYSRGARAPAEVSPEPLPPARRAERSPSALPDHPSRRRGPALAATSTGCRETRSEERRVGKEC